MITRYSIKCQTCNKIHTVRINVGHNLYQEHSFLCSKCSEIIKIGLEVDFEKITTNIKYVENCVFSDTEGTIVNLHPEFMVSKDFINSDLHFPSIENMKFLNDHLNLFENILNDPEKLEKLNYVKQSKQTVDNAWKVIKKAWSLSQNDQDELSQKYLSNYNYDNFDDEFKLNKVLFHFLLKMFFPKGIKMFEELGDFIKPVAQKYKQEFIKFTKFYNDNLHESHLKRYFELLSEYFNSFSEFNQTLMYNKSEMPIPTDFVSTSINFEQVKMFYGNAFEILTSNFTILACLNNISNGRAFNEFQQMDLDKYLTIDKANRANPFKDTYPLNRFSENLQSTLRNASHHKSMYINSHGVISYRTGGTGAKREISYGEYLYKCNELIISISVLLVFELMLSLES